jgi:hypothetical protein
MQGPGRGRLFRYRTDAGWQPRFSIEGSSVAVPIPFRQVSRARGVPTSIDRVGSTPHCTASPEVREEEPF